MASRRTLEYPDCSIYDFLYNNSKRYPDACAIDYFSSEMSYRSLLWEIDRCAAALKMLGVDKGDAVTVCLPNIPQAVIAFYAINKIGAIANMIHPLSAENEISHYLRLSESKIIIALDMVGSKIADAVINTPVEKVILASVKDYMPMLLRLAYTVSKVKKHNSEKRYLDWNGFMELAGKYTKDAYCHCSGSDCGVILYSGGTTGKPKGIMLSNLNFNALALQSIDGCGCLKEGDRVLSVMPVFHGFGLGVCIHTVLNFGGVAIILPQFKPKDFHKLIFKYRPNVIAGVPAIYEGLIHNKRLDGKDMSFIKCIISGGDSLPAPIKQKLNSVLLEHGCSAKVREGYGLTECVTGSCLAPENSTRYESVGLPYADTFYKIVDIKTGRELPEGEVGEIVLRGPTVMMRYLKEPEETAMVLKVHDDGFTWLHTGDAGYMDGDGYVYFKQRIKRMIISCGYNIYPQNIEAVIDSHEEVMTCAVVGVPDNIRGQKVKAFVVCRNQNVDKEWLRGSILKHCEKNIAKYAMPREIEFVDSLPKTLVGKIAYNELINR